MIKTSYERIEKTTRTTEPALLIGTIRSEKQDIREYVRNISDFLKTVST